MCMREREREKMSVFEREYVRERKREFVSIYEKEREYVSMCV